MILKGDAKFKGKLTRGLKNDVRNLVNFHASSRKYRIEEEYGKVQKSYAS